MIETITTINKLTTVELDFRDEGGEIFNFAYTEDAAADAKIIGQDIDLPDLMRQILIERARFKIQQKVNNE